MIKKGCTTCNNSDGTWLNCTKSWDICFDSLRGSMEYKLWEPKEEVTPEVGKYTKGEDVMIGESGEPSFDSNTPKWYNYSYKGIKFDVYRMLTVLGVTCPAIIHAIKKLVRAGDSIKSEKQDIEEVIKTLNRKLEMLEEDLTDQIKEDE